MNLNEMKLADCCISIADGDHQAPPKAEKGIPFVIISNITYTNQFDFSDTMFVPESYYEKLDFRRKAQKNDVLYSVVGSFGIPVFMRENQQFVFQRHIAILRPDPEKVVPRFLYYTMLSRDFYMKADAAAIGAAQRTVSLTALRNMKIELPELDTQAKIANVLSAYDDLIENNQKQIKLLEEMTQRLYKEWFIDMHFPGYENAKMTNGLPEGWLNASILNNDVFIFTKSPVKSFDGEKDYFATADVTNTYLSGVGEKVTYTRRPSRASVQPIINSVWFARMSNSYKILNCYGASEKLSDTAIISSGFAGFTAPPGMFEFVYVTIASKMFDDEKNRYATGATQVSLTNEGLKKINILLPNKDLIRKFSKLCSPIIQKSELLKTSNKNLFEARDRLLPKLMNGEIEV